MTGRKQSSKEARASSLQGLIENGIIHFPKFQDWYKETESEFLQFPKGSNDDRVDSAALIGLFVNGLIPGEKPPEPEKKRGLLSREDFFED